MTARWEIAIERRAIRQAAIRPLADAPLAPGEVEVAIGLVGMTANNVTYAAAGEPTPILGEEAGYWDFFGPRDEPGRLPVWGFATVTRSAVEGIAAGEELWGYWPLASHALLRPDVGGGAGFTDTTPRRAGLPAFYNRYLRVAALGDYDPADRDWWPIYRPLFLTGWLIADQFAEAGDHGAATVLVSGASSKTALSFAHAMRERKDRPRLVGLASARSEAFTRGAGLYDAVVIYDEVAGQSVERAALVDFAGDAGVTAAVHERFGDSLAIDLKIGLTHWDAPRAPPPAIGPTPAWFFAPERLARRAGDWGGAGLRARTEAAWRGFMPVAKALTPVTRERGADGALAAWDAAVTGRADPAKGVLVAP